VAESVREFFETLPTRVDASKAAGVNASYRFDVSGAGSWTVRVGDAGVDVSENGGDADCTISTSEDDFLKIIRGEQNPTTAYMTGKIRVKGDMGVAMKLQRLF
jgi:putative sterol carrier protein